MTRSKKTFTLLLTTFLLSIFALNAEAVENKKSDKQTPDSLKIFDLKDFYGKTTMP